MLTSPQKSTIKQAQRAAGLDDADYRDALQACAHVSTSTDPRMGDRGFDTLMSYLEAIYWLAHDHPHRPFLARGYWRNKNTAAETSRDRYAARDLQAEIELTEIQLRQLGCSDEYLDSIRGNIDDPSHRAVQRKYLYALRRTLKYRLAKQDVAQPF